jgi:hypothetical protein
MENAAVLAWYRDGWELVEPVTVCRVAPVATAADQPCDLDAFETEPEVYARGYLWCECFTAVCPDGEFGHIQEPRLLYVSRAEFDAARHAIHRGEDGVLERWLTYRLDAVRDELLPPDALSDRDRAAPPVTVFDPDRWPWLRSGYDPTRR